MGICNGTKGKANKESPEVKKGFQDDETGLQFKVQLSNFKGKNLTYRTCYIKIKFGEVQEYESRKTNNNPNPDFNIDDEFSYVTSNHELINQYLTITLWGEDKKWGSCSVNLYKIATGAVHNNFKLYSKDGSTARIAFDVKMCQNFSIDIKSCVLVGKLLENLTEKKYLYSMALLDGENRVESEYSAEFENCFLNMSIFEQKVVKHEPEEENPSASSLMDLAVADEKEGDSISTKLIKKPQTSKQNNEIKQWKKDSNDNDNPENNSEIMSPNSKQNRNLNRVPKVDFNLYQCNGSQQSINNNIKSDRVIKNQRKNQKVMKNRKQDFLDLNEEPEKNKLLWNDQDGGIIVQHDLWISRVINSSQHFSIWVIKQATNSKIAKHGEIQTEDLEDEPDLTEIMLIGECHLSIHNFLRDLYFRPVFDIANLENNFETKQWLDGITKGSVKGTLNIKCSPFLKQHICGLNTEDEKVQKMVSVISESKSKRMLTELKDLNDLKTSIEDKMFNILNINNKLTGTAIRDEIQRMRKYLYAVVDILRETHIEKTICFQYSSNMELVKSQELLIAFGMVLVQYAEGASEVCEQVLYDVIKAIFKRGELSMQNLCLDKLYPNNNLNSPDLSPTQKSTTQKQAQNYELKKNIGLLYQTLLYNSLALSLSHLEKTAISETERAFIEYFQAFSYFRIPEFRQELNKCLDADNEHIAQLKGTEFEKINDKKIIYEDDMLVSQLDWHLGFYICLADEPKYKENIEFLTKTLDKKKWHHRFQKRGIGFMHFVKNFCNYINYTVCVKQSIPWQDIPGYNLILRVFLAEMNTKGLNLYPEAQMEAAYSLLFNEKLQQIFCSTIYEKTNLNDGMLVLKAFDLIDSWFQGQKDNKKKIPSDFDHHGLMKGVFMVLSDDNSLSVAKAIWFMYKNFFMFPDKIIHEFHKYLFGKAFLGLFTHWSYTVRFMFHNLIWYRIYHKHKWLRRASINLRDTETLKLELIEIDNMNRDTKNDNRADIFNDLINLELNKTFLFLRGCKKNYEAKQKEIIAANKFKSPVRRKKLMKAICPQKKISYSQINETYGLDNSNYFEDDLGLQPNELEFQVDESFKNYDEEILSIVNPNLPTSKRSVYGMTESPMRSEKKRLSMRQPSGIYNGISQFPGKFDFMVSETSNLQRKQSLRRINTPSNSARYPESSRRIENNMHSPIKNSQQSILYSKQRSFLDQNDQTDNMHLEDFQLIYLNDSFKEFENGKEQYVLWNKRFEDMVESKKLTKEKDLYQNHEVPYYSVKVQYDEQESRVIDKVDEF